MPVNFNLPVPLGTYATPGTEVWAEIDGLAAVLSGYSPLPLRVAVDLGTATARATLEDGSPAGAIAGPSQTIAWEIAQDGDKEIYVKVSLPDLAVRFTVEQDGEIIATASSVAEVLAVVPDAVATLRMM